jgi:hypothetical protein
MGKTEKHFKRCSHSRCFFALPFPASDEKRVESRSSHRKSQLKKVDIAMLCPMRICILKFTEDKCKKRMLMRFMPKQSRQAQKSQRRSVIWPSQARRSPAIHIFRFLAKTSRVVFLAHVFLTSGKRKIGCFVCSLKRRLGALCFFALLFLVFRGYCAQKSIRSPSRGGLQPRSGASLAKREMRLMPNEKERVKAFKRSGRPTL